MTRAHIYYGRAKLVTESMGDEMQFFVDPRGGIFAYSPEFDVCTYDVLGAAEGRAHWQECPDCLRCAATREELRSAGLAQLVVGISRGLRDDAGRPATADTRDRARRKVMSTLPKQREIRAQYDETLVTVYQAFSTDIADAALAAQTLRPPFKIDRMTWIKPSFMWMMYRSDWASRPSQERILALSIEREGFEWALAHASVSHFEPAFYDSGDAWKKELSTSPVRVQWDPERDVDLTVQPFRAIQIGLGTTAVPRYVESWIRRIEDVTSLAVAVRAQVELGNISAARALVPREVEYPLPPLIAQRIHAT